MQKRCIWISGVRQAALSVAHTRCDNDVGVITFECFC